jgi:hypothetical protein
MRAYGKSGKNDSICSFMNTNKLALPVHFNGEAHNFCLRVVSFDAIMDTWKRLKNGPKGELANAQADGIYR